MHGLAGGLIAGWLFVLPGFVALMALSVVYALYGGVGLVSALFFGLKAAVLAIVLQPVVRIGRRALKSRVMLGIAAVAFVAIFVLHVPFPPIILTAGLIGFVGAAARLPAFSAGVGHGSDAVDEYSDADSRLTALER
jgi:chromate transporter